MSMVQRYRTSTLRGLTTENRLSGVSLKFFNFFMKFRLDKLDRHDEFYWKTQKLVIGPKSIDFEHYKTEQLRWISDPETQERSKGSYIEASRFKIECKRIIKFFLDELHRYINARIDLSQIFLEGYKVTIESRLTLRPRSQSRLRPRAYGFHYNTIISQVPSPNMHVAYLWGGEGSGFHSYNSAFNAISRI